MSVCGHCGLGLEEGAAACGHCGFIVAPQRSANAGGKWGTLDIKRAPPRAATAAVAAPAPAPAPAPARAPLTAADPMSVNEVEPSEDSGPSLELDAPPPRLRAAARPQSAPLGGPKAEPRTGSRPIGGREPPARGASRPLSRPLGADAGPPVRGASRPLGGPLAVDSGHQPASAATRAKQGREGQPARAPAVGGVHDAGNPRGGSAARAQAAPIARANARSQSGTMPIPQPTAAGDHLDTGLLDMDGDFSGALHGGGPALEVASLSPHRREEPAAAHAPPEAPREEAVDQRARRVRDLARYAPPPAKLLGTARYFLRIYSRRRELQAQIYQLTQQRKRLDVASDDALCTLGQTIYTKRSDVRLRELAAQLRVIAETAQEVQTKAAAAKRSEHAHNQQLAGIEQELAAAQAKADPVQAREQLLMTAIADHKAQIKRREMLVRKADAELKQLKMSADAASLSRIAQVDHEREENYGQMQSLNVQLLPLEEDLAALRGTLREHLDRLEQIEQRKQRILDAMVRDQGREKIASGGVHSAYREALRSLAQAALRTGLAELAPEAQKAAVEAGERAAVHRESEELMRSAVGCYDLAAYTRGMQLLVGSAIGTFLLFVLLIIF